MVDMTVGGHAWKAVGIAAIGLVVAGCGDSGGGTAAPTTTAVSVAASPTSVDAEAKVWDPCSLPDSAIDAAGLKAGSKESGAAGVDFTGWKVCNWNDQGRKYGLAVMSSERSLAEVRQRTDYSEWNTLTIGSRAALEFRPVGAIHDQTCFVAVEVPAGTVVFKVQNRYSAVGALPPCSEAQRVSGALAQYLPTV
ncbi:DUF3558 domain-containing protein [Nocardia sp. NPDC050718]|uniref:DUF3558 domain-containing protein n=1 Tax=Nocardia sp. NPDC050718 TaxID=3155788 RepID=UPI0033C0D52F